MYFFIISVFTYNFISIKSSMFYFRFGLFAFFSSYLIFYNKNILKNLFYLFLFIYLSLFLDSIYQYFFQKIYLVLLMIMEKILELQVSLMTMKY